MTPLLVGTENFNIVVLIVLVALCCVTVDEILEHYAVFNSIVHIEVVLYYNAKLQCFAFRKVSQKTSKFAHIH